MAVHFSIHAWKIPWTEEPGGLQFMGSQESVPRKGFSDFYVHTSLEQLSMHTSVLFGCQKLAATVLFELEFFIALFT